MPSIGEWLEEKRRLVTMLIVFNNVEKTPQPVDTHRNRFEWRSFDDRGFHCVSTVERACSRGCGHVCDGPFAKRWIVVARCSSQGNSAAPGQFRDMSEESSAREDRSKGLELGCSRPWVLARPVLSTCNGR